MVQFIDGKFVKDSDAKVSAFDLAYLRSYGVFEYLRTYKGKPFHLEDHLNRLFLSAMRAQIPIQYYADDLKQTIERLLEENAFEESSIRMVLSAGNSVSGMNAETDPKLSILVTKLTEPSVTPIKLRTYMHERFLPNCKSTNYFPAEIALSEAKEHGADDALFINAQNEILECTRSNFFGIKGNTLVTCKEGILEGITRELILRFADHTEIRPFSTDELSSLDGAFITWSSSKLVPVHQINDTQIPLNSPLFSLLAQRFSHYIEQENWLPLTLAQSNV